MMHLAFLTGAYSTRFTLVACVRPTYTLVFEGSMSREIAAYFGL
jgi:hypothetical protein